MRPYAWIRDSHGVVHLENQPWTAVCAPTRTLAPATRGDSLGTLDDEGEAAPITCVWCLKVQANYEKISARADELSKRRT